jgi:DNA-directed RNA polymerase II subunit RPB3
MASFSYYCGGEWMNFPYSKVPRKPQIQVTHASRELVRFTLRDTDVSVANALRRIMLAEVPTVAIEIVNMDDNDTVLFDEFIAHRMGLLPLSCHGVGDIPPDDGFLEYKDCSCFDGCAKCTREFTLDVTNREDKVLSVTHFEIKESSKQQFQDPDEIPYNKVQCCPFRNHTLNLQDDRDRNGIIIAKMKKDQSLKMACLARKGIPKYHAKFMPVSTVLYQFDPIITLNREMLDALTLDEKIDLIQSCPRKTLCLDVEDKVQIRDRMACIFEDEVETKCKEMGKKGMVTMKMDTNVFHFTVEAVSEDGPRSAIDVVRASIRILDYKMSEFLRDAYGDPITKWLPKEPAERV